jgi:hypothetical protein
MEEILTDKYNNSTDYIRILIFLPPFRMDIYEFDNYSSSNSENNFSLKKDSPKLAAVLSEGRQIKGLFVDFIFLY